jgi:hypothetical protein
MPGELDYMGLRSARLSSRSASKSCASSPHAGVLRFVRQHLPMPRFLPLKSSAWTTSFQYRSKTARCRFRSCCYEAVPTTRPVLCGRKCIGLPEGCVIVADIWE